VSSQIICDELNLPYKHKQPAVFLISIIFIFISFLFLFDPISLFVFSFLKAYACCKLAVLH